jgi:hypothetical protein
MTRRTARQSAARAAGSHANNPGAPRRGHPIQTIRLALIAIASIAAAGCGSSASNPATHTTPSAPTQPTASQPAATTTPTAPAKPFISQHYGFQVTLTTGWSEHDARINWNGRKLQGLDSPAFANFTDAMSGRTLATAAAPAKRMTLAEWRTAMVRAAPPVCSEAPSGERTTLDGEPALTWTATCSDGYQVHKLAALHGTRGYMILLASPTGASIAENQRVFEAIRQSFRFTH